MQVVREDVHSVAAAIQSSAPRQCKGLEMVGAMRQIAPISNLFFFSKRGTFYILAFWISASFWDGPELSVRPIAKCVSVRQKKKWIYGRLNTFT